MRFKRIFLVVLDSLGVGEAIDAATYGDQGASTLGHIMENYDLFIPNLKKLGFLNTLNMDENEEVEAYYTIARPNNSGKDSLSGHYEMTGIYNSSFFKIFGEGFPRELLNEIERITGRRVIGNKCGDEEEIINELGETQMNYGALIVYSSTDSSLIVSAHEDSIPVGRLYEYCEAIRKITLREEWKVARVVARPFLGKPGKFRFANSDRKDYAVKPPKESVLDYLKKHDYSVITIGKTSDIFDGQGITKTIKASSNMETINKLTDIMGKSFEGLCFANLSDFDTNGGHHRSVEDFAKGIEELDVEIPMILNKLEMDDLLILTADHGNDPTFPGRNHTRENVPLIFYSRSFIEPKRLEISKTLADIAATIADNYQIETPEIGSSLLNQLK